MHRPSALELFAVIAGLVFLFVVIGALLRMPYQGPTRVVHVNTEETP